MSKTVTQMAKRIVNVDDICPDDDEQDEIEVKLCEECKDRFKCKFYIGFVIGGFFRRIKYAFQLFKERREDRPRAFGLRKAREDQ